MNATILVITGEANWTRRAVHLAAAMARDAGAGVGIIKLLPVARLEDLGAGGREELLDYGEYDALVEWVATAEDYGVAVQVELFEYVDYSGALLTAAEQLTPLAIFAPPPPGRPEFIGRLRLRLLRRRLARPLYTLGPGDNPPAWTEIAPEPAAAASAAPAANT